MQIKEFTKKYIENLKALLDNIDETVVEQIVEEIEKLLINKGRLYVLGNGGSSATASHMVNDLGTGLRRRDIINLDVVSLGDNSPVVTAIANDIGYDNIFYMQMKGLIKPEDVVLAISCSGNSPNIVKAIEYAKDQGCKIIGVSGFDGGKLKEISDIKFHIDAPKGEYGLVEDVHMILDHIIYSYYIQKGN
uniref:SIS domain-containing protein n=1 Tax=Aliarcobacter sp. TaxID=2321116 RepID=UPI004047E35C